MPTSPDSSARGFIYSGIAWLVVGVTALALSGIQLLAPRFLTTEFASFGRMRAVASIAILFGWLTQAGLGCVYYIIPRVTGAAIRSERAGSTAGILLNGALSIGVLFTLFDGVSGQEFLEIPSWLGALIVLALVIAAVNVVATVAARSEPRLYPSVWYLTGAAIWAPMALALGTIPSFSGASASIAHLFSLNGYLTLWLGMAGIGALYYVVPRATGNALYSYRLSLIGFWWLAFAGPLAGQSRMIFGAAPDWLETVSITASIALLVPAVTVVVNVIGTLHGAWGKVGDHPSLRFAVGGAVVWAVAILQGTVQSLRSIAQVVGASEAITGQVFLLQIAFTLLSASAIIYAFPRLMGRVWAGRVQLTVSFWSSAAAAALIAAGTWGAAIASGVAYRAGVIMERAASFGAAFDLVSAVTSRFRLAYALGFVVLAIAQWIFALTVLRTTTSGEPHPIEVVAPELFA